MRKENETAGTFSAFFLVPLDVMVAILNHLRNNLNGFPRSTIQGFSVELDKIWIWKYRVLNSNDTLFPAIFKMFKI